MSEHDQGRQISLYLHFPFCERKCRYCDFLSGPASEEARNEYIELLCKEIRSRSVLLTGASVDTVFFGGGTPSLMTPAQLEWVMRSLRDNYAIMDEAEISMEVNPGTADPEKLRSYRKSGVNRLSIGVQSFDDAELRLLGRIHSAEQALEIFRAAREAGFSNINLDLMSALPGQTLETWSRTLREAVELGPEHISAYSLIIEEGTPFAAMYASGQLPELPSDEEDREIYHFTGRFLAEKGYRRYEISNYALVGTKRTAERVAGEPLDWERDPDADHACRHNCGYWTGHEYLGLGLGASSDLGGERFRNPSEMEEYKRAVAEVSDESVDVGILSGEIPDEKLRRERQIMTPEDRMEEFMFLGLRMTDGVSEREFLRRFGNPIEEVYGSIIERQLQQGVIRKYAAAGDHRIALSEFGLDVANHVMAEYLL